MSESYPAELFGRADEPVTRFAVTLLIDRAADAGGPVRGGRTAGRPAHARRRAAPARAGSGALIVDGGLAALECAVQQATPAGDHLLVIARVTGVPYVADSGAPLVRFHRRYLPLGSSGSPE